MIEREANAGIERFSTGVGRLDDILNGGIPARSITMIAGEAGAGKTMLTLQTIFSAARRGIKSIYFTTLSEPAVKLIRYMQLFDFFDEKLLENCIVMADLGSTLRAQGAEAALMSLTERVEEEEPELVVVDSFKAIHDLVAPARRRTFVYDLTVIMAGWGTTTLLLGEYTEAEMLNLPEFAIADGIIRLGALSSELTRVRTLEVRKLRGSAFVSGVHFFDITDRGIDFVPRVRAPDRRDQPTQHAAPSPKAVRRSETPGPERVSTGIQGLDRILRGGWPAASSTVSVGGTGTGKTIIGLSFLLEGARRGEAGVFLALEETPEQLRSTARGFGWDLEALEQQRLLAIQYTAPIELSTDRFLMESLDLVKAVGARRLVLDSLTGLSLGAVSDRRFKELVYALTKHLRMLGLTTIMNLEVAELLGTGQISGHGLSFAADNVLYMRYVEAAGRLGRAITVIKSRGIEHGTELCELAITREGVIVGGALVELQGVLSGLPYAPHERRPGTR